MRNDRENASRRMQQIQAMNAVYAFDDEVNRLFRQLCTDESHVGVIWPTEMRGEQTALSVNDLDLLAYQMLDPQVNTLFIPQNTGNHWYPIVLHRNGEQWEAHQIQTRADGSCGRDTVAQAKLIAKQGFTTYANQNPAKVSNVNMADKAAIQKVLDFVNPPTVKSAQRDLPEENLKLAFKLDRLSTTGIEFELTALADAEKDGNKIAIANAQKNLIKLFKGLSADKRNQAIDRLVDSNLSAKPSIAYVIDKALESSASVARNPLALMSKPKSKRDIELPVIRHSTALTA